MIPVSTDYRQQLIAGNRNWVIKIPVFLSGNTGSTPDFTLTNEHIWDNGIVLDEAISSDNSFDIGVAIVGSLKVVIDNITGNFSQYDFYGAKLTLWLGVEGDVDSGDNQRMYRIGFFVVDTPSYNGSLITLNCLDNMTWFDTDFDTSWVNWTSSSTTTGSVVSTICSHVGVALATSQFPWYDISLKGLKPEQKLTCREVLQYIAQICCCYCKIDTAGELNLKWHDKSAINNLVDYDGGTFNTTTTPYSDGDAVDGMLFDPWTTGTSYNGGTFDDLLDRAFISENYDIEVSTDDIWITGCRVRNNSSKEKAYDVLWVDSNLEPPTGTHERYVLVIENNPFVKLDSAASSSDQTRASNVANRVGNTLAGLRVRGFNATSLADFSYETGDMATVIDFRGNRYYTWITHFTFTTNNSERFNCGAQSVKQRSEQRFSTLAETTEKARVALTAYDTAVKELNTLGQNAIGYSEYFYPTTGSNRVMYRYNGADTPSGANPKFPNSTVVFKISGDGVFIAQKALGGIDPDGTCHFTNGYDANSGTAILNLVYVRGLNADWIKAGSIDASVITVNNLNASNITSGTMSASRITSGTMSADRISGGTISGNNVTVTNINASNINSGNLNCDRLSGGTINGQTISGGSITGSVFTSNNSSETGSTKIEGGSVKINATADNYLDIRGGGENVTFGPEISVNSSWVQHRPEYLGWAIEDAYQAHHSDKKLKKKIKDIPTKKSREIILGARPRYYEFKKDLEGGVRSGFVAQELRESLDKIGDTTAIERESIRRKGEREVIYEDFIAHLVNTTQDLYKEVDNLKQELAEMKARIK